MTDEQEQTEPKPPPSKLDVVGSRIASTVLGSCGLAIVVACTVRVVRAILG